MNKGSKYKSGQRPTFRIWDNEKNDWFEPTYEGWDGKIEELLLSPTGDLTMRTFTDFKHESVFPERFEIVLDEPQKISWRKAISVLEHHFQCEIPINLDNVVKGYREMSGILNTVEFELSKRNSELTAKEFIFEALESKKHKVKVPAFVAEYVEWCHFEEITLWEVSKSIRGMPEEVWKWLNSINQDIFARAMLDGYEVEEEPKWVLKHQNGMYFTRFDEEMEPLLGGEKKAYRFTDKSKAEALTIFFSGKVEKV